VLRTVGDQPTLWESLLPPEALRMPEELVRVDRLLDDGRFFVPFVPFFHTTMGRPSTPIETYLRLMFLKYRYRLGFESLCREVTDSISWQRFCRIPLGGTVPNPTTLMKITTRCGEAAINELNNALLAKAAEAKVLKTNRLRADTTVVEANVEYPSDSSLLAKGVARIARSVGRIKRAGLAARTKFVDRTRSVHKRARSINANLRRRTDDKIAEVKRINGELADIAQKAAHQAARVVRNARRKMASAPRVSGRATAEINRLERLAARTAKIAEQTRQRLDGTTPDGATRIVSLSDGDARPIVKGRLGRPVEFGYKAQIVDNEDGVIVDHNVEIGNPPDAPMLAPAIERIKQRAGKAPRAVTADRGYGETGVENDLRRLGVRYVALPTKGKPNTARRQVEARRAFRRMVRWRTGCEGRINCAKRDFGLRRTRYTGIAGARTWCGHGVFNHNLVKISGLID
jgi:IS5 family transposase